MLKKSPSNLTVMFHNITVFVTLFKVCVFYRHGECLLLLPFLETFHSQRVPTTTSTGCSTQIYNFNPLCLFVLLYDITLCPVYLFEFWNFQPYTSVVLEPEFINAWLNLTEESLSGPLIWRTGERPLNKFKFQKFSAFFYIWLKECTEFVVFCVISECYTC